MSYSLPALPAEIVGRILDLDGMSVGAMLLWLSGDTIIQRKIGQGVTRIRFVRLGFISSVRLPKFIENLRTLRYLEVDRENWGLLCPVEASAIIRNLSSTLKTLKLNFKNSVKGLPLRPEISAPSATDSTGTLVASSNIGDWTLAKAFPILETLEVIGIADWTPEDMSALPVTLTSLGLSLSDNENLHPAYYKSLPRTLLSLRTFSYKSPSGACWAHLPPHLTSLTSVYTASISIATNEHFKSLPRSITRLQNVIYAWPAPEELPCLPSSLTELELEEFTSNFNDTPPFDHFPAVNNIGSGTHVKLSAKSIRALPQTVATLNVCADISALEAKDWPKALRSLIFIPLTSTFKPKALPSNLTRLHVRGADKAIEFTVISNLPRTLLSLTAHCIGKADEKVKFPPKLTSLNIFPLGNSIWSSHVPYLSEDCAEYGVPTPSEDLIFNPQTTAPKVTYCFPFHKLPASITKLHVGAYLPASKMKFLPRRLKDLHVLDIFKDTDFDPQNAKEMQAMAEVYQVGRIEGIRDLLDISQMKQATMQGLLPRTLKYLRTSVAGFSQNDAWKEMPPQLQEIFFSAFRIDTDTLLSIPSTCLRSLYATVTGFREDHFKALPQRIVELSLSGIPAGDMAKYSPHSILGLPPACHTAWIVDRSLHEAMKKLKKLRAKAMDESDLALFSRLMDPNDTKVIEEYNIYKKYEDEEEDEEEE